MGWIFLGFILLIVAWFGPRLFGAAPSALITTARVVTVLFAVFSFALTSWVKVSADEVGHLKRVYLAEELPPGKIIGFDSQMGPQAKILGPGFHVSFLIRVLYNIEYGSIVEIPAGFYGKLVARDGVPLPPNTYIAPAFDETGQKTENMLQAEYFLRNGGVKGPQLTVLTPGRYRLNRYLFEITTAEVNHEATIIPAGRVGVVKSNVTALGQECHEIDISEHYGFEVTGALSVPLVPKNCIGIWSEPLYPGAYYLNKDAYDVTIVDTRAQTWRYEGGYNSKSIDLEVDQEGRITQQASERVKAVPDNAADAAISVKIEGWTIHQNLRVVVQVRPNMAPVVVASTGSLSDIENKILTPSIQSIVRNVLGGAERIIPVLLEDGTKTVRSMQVLDVIEERDFLETVVEGKIVEEGRKAGVDITEVRFGNPDTPPELLVARKREQLATQLGLAYIQEKRAQDKRILAENARSTADQQPELVAAQIEVMASEQYVESRNNRGEAERAYLTKVAQGQEAQALVLGKDRVLILQLSERILSVLQETPELLTAITLPSTVVVSPGGGLNLEGMAAVLGGKTAPAHASK